MKKREESNKSQDRISKGSITVEATFIVGLSLLVIFIVLALCFYMHNKSWYTSVAGETTISAATEGTRKDGDFKTIIGDKVSTFANGTKFPDTNQGLISKSSGELMQIDTQAKVPVLINNTSFEMEVSVSSKVIKPVKFIRKIQSLQMIKEQVDAG